MKFIKLTLDNGKPVFINPEHIVSIQDFNNDTDVITVAGNSFGVYEKAEEIMGMISGEKSSSKSNLNGSLESKSSEHALSGINGKATAHAANGSKDKRRAE